MHASEVAAIILAAGQSKRLKQPKQLLEFTNKTLIEITLDALTRSNISDRLVITGAHHEKIAPAIPNEKNIIRYGDWSDGMGSSIAFGVDAALKAYPQAKAILVLLSDQPYITSSHIDRLISTFATAGNGVDAVATVYDSGPKLKHGVPTLFSEKMYQSLQALSGDCGAQQQLNSGHYSVMGIEPDFDTIDIDTNEDLNAINTGQL